MMIQLRTLSWNNNDEFIFIASLELVKSRSAPIYCMIDQEGDIHDYTSTFAWMFLKKVKNNNQIKRKNIQELVPSFFEVVENQKLTEEKEFVFREKVSVKKRCQELCISFFGSEVFVKGDKVAYLVEGRNTEKLHRVDSERSISHLIDLAVSKEVPTYQI